MVPEPQEACPTYWKCTEKICLISKSTKTVRQEDYWYEKSKLWRQAKESQLAKLGISVGKRGHDRDLYIVINIRFYMDFMISLVLPLFSHRPDMTFMVDWALSNNYLSISLFTLNLSSGTRGHWSPLQTDQTISITYQFKTQSLFTFLY